MTVIDVMALPLDDGFDKPWEGGPNRYDYNRLPDRLRHRAMLAQGTVVEGLPSALRRVVDSGQALAWAKSELPHGEYLPWVQLGCGLKPRYAQQLIQACEWANAQHAAHLDACTDVTMLFLLSANTTTEEVREWFMERCAAGDPPTRKEVQERKRTARQPRQLQPTENLALNLIRKGEVERIREALALAEQAQVVTPEDVMAEQRLRELGRQQFIPGANANFHRMKDGSWIRMPHAGHIDVVPQSIQALGGSLTNAPADRSVTDLMDSGLMTMDRAATVLGMPKHTLTQSLTPGAIKKRGGPLARNGYLVTREGRGMVRLSPITPTAAHHETDPFLNSP